MRFFGIGAWALGLAAGASLAQSYPTPGFDCANATTPQELRICRSPQLGELDGRHWYLAERAIKGSRDPEATRSGVESWIAEVRNVCETDKCLVDAYTARNAALEHDVAALAPVRPPPMPAGLPVPAPPPAAEAQRVIEPPPPAIAPSPTPPALAPQKPVMKAPPPAPDEDGTSSWPFILAAALVAAFAARTLSRPKTPVSGPADPTGKAPPGDRG